MGAKDIKAKEYLSDNTRFADLCNYYLFEGKNMIRPESLVAQDTTELLSVFGTTKKELQVQKWRDILKQSLKRRIPVYMQLLELKIRQIFIMQCRYAV